eukprot:5564774-Pleurochrysis_carterae.AAC.1
MPLLASTCEEADETNNSASSKRRRGAVSRIIINVRATYDKAVAEVKKLRSELMSAWKALASLRRERDQMSTDLRGAARRTDRSEVLASQAREWQREAD